MTTMSVAEYARDCAAQGLRGDYSVCRSDFTVAQGYAAYSQALQDSGWDPSSGEAPPPEVIAALTVAGQALDDADFQAASDRVSAWFAANCGS